jgi:hypothetical protein
VELALQSFDLMYSIYAPTRQQLVTKSGKAPPQNDGSRPTKALTQLAERWRGLFIERSLQSAAHAFDVQSVLYVDFLLDRATEIREFPP